jgi:hypothetical protein
VTDPKKELAKLVADHDATRAQGGPYVEQALRIQRLKIARHCEANGIEYPAGLPPAEPNS